MPSRLQGAALEEQAGHAFPPAACMGPGPSCRRSTALKCSSRILRMRQSTSGIAGSRRHTRGGREAAQGGSQSREGGLGRPLPPKRPL